MAHHKPPVISEEFYPRGEINVVGREKSHKLQRAFIFKLRLRNIWRNLGHAVFNVQNYLG